MARFSGFTSRPASASILSESSVAAIGISDPQCLLDNPGECFLQLLYNRNKLIDPRFNQQVLIDTTPLPDDIPKVKELGASSAPLLSASFFIGARCKAYNDDYMMCKAEANGRGELECMKEGRKVTRCAASVYEFPFLSGRFLIFTSDIVSRT